MIKTLVSIPLDMRLDVLEEMDFGPGRCKEFLVNWTELGGICWISEKMVQNLEELFIAWDGPPRP